MTVLKSCPFCGGEARIQEHGYSTDDYRVYCKNRSFIKCLFSRCNFGTKFNDERNYCHVCGRDELKGELFNEQ